MVEVDNLTTCKDLFTQRIIPSTLAILEYHSFIRGIPYSLSKKRIALSSPFVLDTHSWHLKIAYIPSFEDPFGGRLTL